MMRESNFSITIIHSAALRRHKKLMGRSVRRAEKLTDRLLRYMGE